ncbi:helix-turn-helix domain-containing protein [Ochrobactrum intermedium]|nr:helix-turn-helix domain-containing protein [Brucella intermedia]
MSLLTPEQAAEALSISHRQLIYLTDDGELPFINIGRGARKIRRYDPADIEAFKNQRKKTECQSTSEKTARTERTPTSSRYAVVDFRATLAKSRSEKRAR